MYWLMLLGAGAAFGLALGVAHALTMSLCLLVSLLLLMGAIAGLHGRRQRCALPPSTPPLPSATELP